MIGRRNGFTSLTHLMFCGKYTMYPVFDVSKLEKNRITIIKIYMGVYIFNTDIPYVRGRHILTSRRVNDVTVSLHTG